MSYKFNPFTGNLDAGGSDIDLASPGPIGGTTPDAGTFSPLNIKDNTSDVVAGANLVTNGTFTGNANGWTLGTNWAYVSLRVRATVSAFTGVASQVITGIEAGKKYLLKWSHTNSVSNSCLLTAKLGDVTIGSSTGGGANQAFSNQYLFTAESSGDLTLSFSVTPLQGGSGNVQLDDVALSEISSTIDPFALVYNADSTLALELRSGAKSLYVGKDAGKWCYRSGEGNIALGESALVNGLDSGACIAIGVNALASAYSIYGNCAIGHKSLASNSKGYFNTSIGFWGDESWEVDNLTTASYCTFIGAMSGFGTSNQYDYATAIGSEAKVDSAGTIVLGRTSDTTVIGATAKDSSNALLQVTGSTKFTGQYINASTKTLTESSATGIVDIAVAAGTVATGEMTYAVEANDGTDYQTLRGRARYAVVNKAGTLTVNLTVIEESMAASAGTLTTTCTATSGTNKITLNLNAVSSLTQTTLRALWRNEHEGGVITAL